MIMQPNEPSPQMAGNRIPWMGPELLSLGGSGLDINPTRKSDCYALGMVIYEVLSGQAPFATCGNLQTFQKVLRGEHPERPQGDEGRSLTDGIWEVLNLCWEPEPDSRPSAEGVLLGLEGTLPSSRPPPDMDGDVETDTEDQATDEGDDPGMFFHLAPGLSFIVLVPC